MLGTPQDRSRTRRLVEVGRPLSGLLLRRQVITLATRSAKQEPSGKVGQVRSDLSKRRDRLYLVRR